GRRSSTPTRGCSSRRRRSRGAWNRRGGGGGWAGGGGRWAKGLWGGSGGGGKKRRFSFKATTPGRRRTPGWRDDFPPTTTRGPISRSAIGPRRPSTGPRRSKRVNERVAKNRRFLV